MEQIKAGYTRVSSILQQWDTFGHIDKTTLLSKAELGTRVHEAIDSHHKGLYMPLDDKANWYFESFVRWEKSIKPKIVRNEERYYCDKMMITGQIDALMEIPGESKPVLVDYKTSACESAKMWPLQACFYHYLVEKAGIDVSDRMLFVQLDRHGELPKVHEYMYTKQLWNICQAAWLTYTYLKS